MKAVPFASQTTDAITFLPEERTFAFFAPTALIVFWSLAQSGGPNTLTWSASKIARFACDRVSLVSLWSGIESRGTHLSETVNVPNSLCRMRCHQYWLPKHLPSIMTVCMFSSVVIVVGRPHLSSSWRLSLPILKCSAHFLIVAYEGAVSSDVAIISA